MASNTATVELGEILPTISEDHILVKFIRKKYKCIMTAMMFFICAQQFTSTVIQGLKPNTLSIDSIQEIVKMLNPYNVTM